MWQPQRKNGCGIPAILSKVLAASNTPDRPSWELNGGGGDSCLFVQLLLSWMAKAVGIAVSRSPSDPPFAQPLYLVSERSTGPSYALGV